MLKKLEAPAAERNKGPILEVLKNIIRCDPSHAFPAIKILEISSGTGQHITHFAKHFPSNIFWQPSEYKVEDFSSISAYIQDYNLTNVACPVFIDISTHYSTWQPAPDMSLTSVTSLQHMTEFNPGCLDYIYNSNLIHISPYECCQGLFTNSGILLKSGGHLITYGPYGQNGIITPDSNVRFDAGLRQSDPTWGVRDIQQQLIPLGKKNGLQLEKIIDMPANNKLLLWTKHS